MLSAEILADLLPSKILGESLFVFEEINSSNTFALDLARKGTQQGTVVLADAQTAGRGRLQRSWFSPPEANIYGSLIFSCSTSPLILGWIPLMAGLAIAQAIENTTNISSSLKWPNDILIHERKTGGILCESFKQNSGETCVVIGFGINVNLPESALPEELKEIATSLQIHANQPLDRHQLLKFIIPAVEEGWRNLMARGPESCQLPYQQRCSTIGQQILVEFPDGRSQEGIAVSIGEQGQLQILPSPSSPLGESDKILNVHAGDIRHIRNSHTAQRNN